MRHRQLVASNSVRTTAIAAAAAASGRTARAGRHNSKANSILAMWLAVLCPLVMMAVLEGGVVCETPHYGKETGSERASVARGRAAGEDLIVTWEGVTFEVAKRPSETDRREHILRDVSGEALPGRLLAIMGSSGSGKSSLLNVLAGRVPAARRNRLVGSVKVGGVPLQQFDTKRYMAYVRQEQEFYPFLSVRETLLIAAGLKLDRRVSHAEREIVVSDTMEKLGLSRVADTLVGDARTPGISGGEKRRLAMGMQLIGLETPSVIFLDEPTSGLDSHQALQLMKTIRDLSKDGHTVLVSIHQPRSSIYALFDDVLLLSEGMVMYHGSKADALPRLASLGHRCPNNFNPADFMVDLISPVTGINGANSHKEAAAKTRVLQDLAQVASKDWNARSSARFRRRGRSAGWWQAGTGDEEEEGHEQRLQQQQRPPTEAIKGFAEDSIPSTRRNVDWRTASELRRQEGLLAVVSASSTPSDVPQMNQRLKGVFLLEPPGRRRSRWHTQFGLLLKRAWRQVTRDKFAALARVALGFGLGGIFGSIFWRLPLTESSIQNRVSLLVNMAINTSMFACIRALQTLAMERPVIAMERIDQGYSASAYLASKVLAEFPLEVVFPLIFGSTVYFAAGLNRPVGGAVKLAKFLGTLLIEAHASSALGLMVGCLSPSMEVANLVGPAIIVVFLLLGGVHQDIPPFLKKMEDVSTIKWAIQGIVTNEMRDIKFEPDGKKLLMGWTLGNGKQVIPGQKVMDQMGFKDGGLQKPTRRLLSLTAAFHFITFINLFISAPRFQHLESLSPPAGSATSRKDSEESHAGAAQADHGDVFF